MAGEDVAGFGVQPPEARAFVNQKIEAKWKTEMKCYLIVISVSKFKITYYLSI